MVTNQGTIRATTTGPVTKWFLTGVTKINLTLSMIAAHTQGAPHITTHLTSQTSLMRWVIALMTAEVHLSMSSTSDTKNLGTLPSALSADSPLATALTDTNHPNSCTSWAWRMRSDQASPSRTPRNARQQLILSQMATWVVTHSMSSRTERWDRADPQWLDNK